MTFAGASIGDLGPGTRSLRPEASEGRRRPGRLPDGLAGGAADTVSRPGAGWVGAPRVRLRGLAREGVLARSGVTRAVTLNELSWFSWPLVDLAPGTLRPDETVVHHWPAPSGMGMLTQYRLLLTSHPHPTHRLVLWEKDLEAIGSFAVQPTPETFVGSVFGPKTSQPAQAVGVSQVPLDSYFAVVVDDRVVFVGYVNHCTDIQGWIDELWCARRVALGWPARPPLGPGRTIPPA